MNDKEKAFWVKEPDQTDHVYCKDCRFFKDSGLWCGYWKMSIYHIGICDNGERKDNG